jgi:uncharacterized protein YdgA (DUF945 family)
MKKILGIIGVVLVLIGLLAGASYWTGTQVEKTLTGKIEQNKQLLTQAGVTMAYENYQRGVFGSQANLSIGFKDPELSKLGKLSFPVDIKHGPIIVGPGVRFGLCQIASTFDLPQKLQQELGLTPFQGPLAKGLGLVNFDGSSSGEVTGPAYTTPIKSDKGNAQLAWGGMQGTVQSGPDGKSADFDISMPSLRIGDPEVSIDFQGMKTTGKMHQGAGPLWFGTSDFQVTTANIANSGKNIQVTANGIKMQSDTATNGGNLHIKVNSQVQEASVPQYRLKNLVVNWELRKLKEDVYRKLMELTQGDPELLMKPETQQAGLGLLQDLLAASPEMEFTQIAYEGDGGKFNARALLAFAGEGGVNLSETPPAALIPRLRAEVDVTAAKELLSNTVALVQGDKNTANLMLEGLAQQQILTTSGTDYAAQLRMANGQVTLNGQPADNLMGLFGKGVPGMAPPEGMAPPAGMTPPVAPEATAPADTPQAAPPAQPQRKGRKRR